MRIVLDMKDLKELLSEKFEIDKIFVAGDDVVIHGKPKQPKPAEVELKTFDIPGILAPSVYNPPPPSIPETPPDNYTIRYGTSSAPQCSYTNDVNNMSIDMRNIANDMNPIFRNQ